MTVLTCGYAAALCTYGTEQVRLRVSVTVCVSVIIIIIIIIPRP